MKGYLEGPGGLPLVKQAGEVRTALPVYFEGNLTVSGTLASGAESVTSELLTVASANAFTVGANGLTNPAFNVDTSTASVATGLNVKGAAATAGVALTVLSSGTNESLTLDAKGTGALKLNSVGGTGAVQIGGAASGANATGLTATPAAAASGFALAVVSTGTDENLTVAAKGAGSITFNPAVVAAAGGKASSGIQFGSLSVGLYTGTGAPTFSAMNGSIYVDSEATSTTTRIYVNKSGAHTAGTTWTNLTTAA